MPSVLVDSNVILDLNDPTSDWFGWSITVIERLADSTRLVVNPIIFAEASVRYSQLEDVDEALPRETFARESVPYEAAFLAGKAFLVYRRRGGVRQTVLPDFFIGAHALVAGYELLTRDPARYRTYFPKLSLIAPE